MASAATWNGAAAALPGFLQGADLSHNALSNDGDALRKRLCGAGPGLYGEITDAALQRIEDMLAGISAYHRHPYRRNTSEWLAVFREGSLRVLDCGPDLPSGAVCVVVIPSLINPSYILDLKPGYSLVRYLAAAGIRPLLLDWGEPGEAEQGFTLTDYIVRRVEPALSWAVEHTGKPVKVLGYCMGGNLALAATVRMPALVSALALLATPWDFRGSMSPLAQSVAAVLSSALPALEDHGTVPVDLLQLFFASLDPTLVDRKFRRFSKLAPESIAAETFVAVEDWSNDGMALSLPVAAECLRDWYGGNLPVQGAWTVAGQPVDPAAVQQPALVVVPRSDRIVPPDSALALAKSLPNAEILRATGGHVTMIAGPRAEAGLWAPLASWLQ